MSLGLTAFSADAHREVHIPRRPGGARGLLQCQRRGARPGASVRTGLGRPIPSCRLSVTVSVALSYSFMTPIFGRGVVYDCPLVTAPRTSACTFSGGWCARTAQRRGENGADGPIRGDEAVVFCPVHVHVQADSVGQVRPGFHAALSCDAGGEAAADASPRALPAT